MAQIPELDPEDYLARLIERVLRARKIDQPRTFRRRPIRDVELPPLEDEDDQT